MARYVLGRRLDEVTLRVASLGLRNRSRLFDLGLFRRCRCGVIRQGPTVVFIAHNVSFYYSVLVCQDDKVIGLGSGSELDSAGW